MPPQAFLALLLFLPCCAQALFGSSNETDFWEDFGNNFATDLAPIISLFGEQVTKQFLSESTTILDTILFAVGPLGIITAIVSCIRVSSSSFLKSVIGRAREPHAVPEVELCSSTSDSVCELWSNGGICRVFGRPKILEFVTRKCSDENFYSHYDGEGIETVPATCGILLIREFLKESESDRKVISSVELLSERPSKWSPRSFVLQTRKWIGKRTRNSVESPGTISSPRHMEQGRVSLSPKEAKEFKSQGREEFAPFPNLALNMGVQKAQTSDLTLSLAAAFGVLLQGSFFGYTTWATWYHSMFYEGGKASNAPLFFTCTVAGTASIILGMALCATLIDRNSKEQRLALSSTKGTDTSHLPECLIFWLQPGGQRIGDQEFDAFACNESKTEYIASWKDRKAPVPIFLVWLGVGLSFAGWIVQFIGLRGQHATVSLYQLCCTIIMSIIRASIRSSRSAPTNELENGSERAQGHELDWQAVRLITEWDQTAEAAVPIRPFLKGQTHWSVGSSAAWGNATAHVIWNTGADMQIGDNIAVVLDWHTQEQVSNLIRWIESRHSDIFALAEEGDHKLNENLKTFEASHAKSNTPNRAAKLMRIRERLAHLTKQLPYQAWEMDTRKTALQLKNALQMSSQLLYPGGHEALIWSARCRLLEPGFNEPPAMPICFCMMNTEAGWTIDENQLEAALGLWSWSVERYAALRRLDCKEWFQRQRSKRIVIRAEDAEATRFILDKWGIPAHVLLPHNFMDRLRLTNLSVPGMGLFGSRGETSEAIEPYEIQGMTSLSVNTASSLLQMMAQDLFTIFVETIGTLRLRRLGNFSISKSSGTDAEEITVIEGMVQSLVSEGLATRNEAIMSVVPTLCPRLGNADSIQTQHLLFTQAMELKRHEKFGESRRVVETLIQLGSPKIKARTVMFLCETYRSELRWMMRQRKAFTNRDCVKKGNNIVSEMRRFLLEAPEIRWFAKVFLNVIDWLLCFNSVSPIFHDDDSSSGSNSDPGLNRTLPIQQSSVLRFPKPNFEAPTPLDKNVLDDMNLDDNGSPKHMLEVALTLGQRFNLGESPVEVRKQLLRWAIESDYTGLVEDLWLAERNNPWIKSAFSGGSDELFWASSLRTDLHDMLNTILFLLEVVGMDQSASLECREELDQSWWETSRKRDFIKANYDQVPNVLAAACANHNGLDLVELLAYSLDREGERDSKYVREAVRSALESWNLETFNFLMGMVIKWQQRFQEDQLELLLILAQWGLKEAVEAVLLSQSEDLRRLELLLERARVELLSEKEERAKVVFKADRDGLVAFLEETLGNVEC